MFGSINSAPKSGWVLYQRGIAGGRAQGMLVEGMRGTTQASSSKFLPPDSSSMRWMRDLTKRTQPQVS